MQAHKSQCICRTARWSKPCCICLAGRHICCTPSGHLQSLSIAIRGSCRVPASRSGGIVTTARAVRRRPPKRRVMFLAPLFAVPILLLGINPASACWRGYAYGYGGYGYALIDPLIHWPTARPMPKPVAVGVASAGGSGEQAVTAEGCQYGLGSSERHRQCPRRLTHLLARSSAPRHCRGSRMCTVLSPAARIDVSRRAKVSEK